MDHVNFQHKKHMEFCRGAGCTGSTDTVQGRRQALPGSLLCSLCRNRLERDMESLPRLYADCGHSLSTIAAPARERVRGTTRKDMPFNGTAAECRSQILGVLSSWANLVVEQRGVSTPDRNVTALSALLHKHSAWLADQPFAGDASEEFTRLVSFALRVTGQSRTVHRRVGACVEAECPGTLFARVDAGGKGPAEIRCENDSSHTWSTSEWTALSQRMRNRAATGTTSAARWLSPKVIARLWEVPPGTVYRLASEHGWRRIRKKGRTYYAEDDVHLVLSGTSDR